MFKVLKEKTTESYKIEVIFPLSGGDTVVAELSAEEALVLADELTKNAETIMDEVYNMPIVPRKVKALIDCGKVSRLEYLSMAEEADTGCTLYQIRTVFTNNTSRTYFYSCKFFENEDLLKLQLQYVRNIPIVFKDKSIPFGVESYNGSIGFNLSTHYTNEDVNPEDELSSGDAHDYH